MQLTELIHHSRSSTLPSISATTTTSTTQPQSQPKELPSLTNKISLPPISDLLATPPPASQSHQQHYNHYIAASASSSALKHGNSNDTIHKSPNVGYATSSSSSISSPSSVQYHNQQSHYFHPTNPTQQQQQQQLQQSQQLPSIIRSHSYPQQPSHPTVNQDQTYLPHHHLTHFPSHEYYPHYHQHPLYTSATSSSSSSSSSSVHNNHPHSSNNARIVVNGDNNNNPNSKRRTRNNLPKEITYVLLRWLNDHLNHPYPNSFEKNQLMMATGLNQQQLSNWFINARRRKIKTLKEQKRMMHMI
ncbi:CUP9 [Candida theae]|uniref:CUP9 n=1 Tax=Candida theae TaxID=1198502 RepID=A0AAD5FXW5_9ASCO|nr:CUP9 [Candida theae]KAI5956061.1 CUP9 [Candida theae]